jgi:hypothetical protein
LKDRTYMSPQPRLSKAVQQLQENRNAEVDIESLAPSDEERQLGSYEAIVAHRTAEVARLKAARQVKPVEPALPAVAESRKVVEQQLGARLNQFAAAEQAAVQARDEEIRAQVTAEVDALASRARGAQTALGIMREKWYDDVAAVAGLDLNAVLRRMPLKETAAEDRNGNAPVFISNHTHLVLLVRHAQPLAGALGSDFEELRKSMEHLSTFTANLWYQTGGTQGYYDTLIGGPSVTWRSAKAHAVHWLTKMEQHVAAVRRLIEQYERLHARVAADLANLGPLEIAAPPPKAVVGALRAFPPEPGGSSFQDFDPREGIRLPQQRTRAEVQPGLARDAKVLDVTTDNIKR